MLAIDVTPPWDNRGMAKAPGKHHRKGMTLAQFFDRFPDDKAAERYLAEARWPDGTSRPVQQTRPHAGSCLFIQGLS